MEERPLIAAAESNSAADRLARALSLVLSPYVVTAATAALVNLRYAPAGRFGLVMALLGIASSALVPFFYAVWLVHSGRATDIHMAVRKERYPIFVVAIASTAAATLLLRLWGAAPVVVGMGVAYCVSGAFFLAVTTRWKISLHTGVLAGSLVVCACAFGDVARLGIPLVPLLGWARVRRHRHSVSQVVVGAVCGAGVTLLSLRPFVS